MHVDPKESQGEPTENQTNPTETQPAVQKTEEPKVSHADDTPAMAEFRKKVLNKAACITLADGRKVLGKITCIDQQKNLVIIDAVEEVPDQYIAKINDKLPIISRSIMKIKNYIDLPQDVLADEEKLKKIEDEFFKNKFYLGQAIIPGHCVTKMEIQKAA